MANGCLPPASGHWRPTTASAAFVEYAFQHGIYAAGASDVQGLAPKLLLLEDTCGRWHAEGVLPDSRVAAWWIVKRSRGGKTAADRKILRNEAAYMALAKAVGPGVFAPLAWENDNLFVPRLDRVVRALAPHQRLGLESLYALAGVADYGARTSHDELCAALLAYSSSPAEDLLEYIKRDALNVVLGNKDNHGRNTAVLKDETGRVRLSPLFDFAPMYLDPEGIARVSRWQGEAETAGAPDWAVLVSRYHRYLGDHVDDLRAFGKTLQGLPDIGRRVGVDEDIVEYHRRAIDNHARQLMAL